MRSRNKQGNRKRRLVLKGVNPPDGIPVKVNANGQRYIGLMCPPPGSERGKHRRSMAAYAWEQQKARDSAAAAERAKLLALQYAHGN